MLELSRAVGAQAMALDGNSAPLAGATSMYIYPDGRAVGLHCCTIWTVLHPSLSVYSIMCISLDCGLASLQNRMVLAND